MFLIEVEHVPIDRSGFYGRIFFTNLFFYDFLFNVFMEGFFLQTRAILARRSCCSTNQRSNPPAIVGKKRDLGILDPEISEKHFSTLEMKTKISHIQSRTSRRDRDLLSSISDFETRTRIEIKTILARIHENLICCLCLD